MMEEEKNVPYFPMFFRLAGRSVLVVGAGAIGSRRIETLLEFGADVLTVAPEGAGRMAEIEKLAADGHFAGTLTWERRCFQPSDVDGKFFVTAASDDRKENDRIVSLCRSRGILVNHAGDQKQCDFYFPAVAREGALVAGICSSGRDHHLVRKTAADLRAWLRERNETGIRERG